MEQMVCYPAPPPMSTQVITLANAGTMQITGQPQAVLPETSLYTPILPPKGFYVTVGSTTPKGAIFLVYTPLWEQVAYGK